MLTSLYSLKGAIEKFEKNKENFTDNSSKSVCISCIVVALVVVVVEVALLYFAVMIALANSTSPAEQFVNVVLAIMFTMPYLLLNVVFNPVARQELSKHMR